MTEDDFRMTEETKIIPSANQIVIKIYEGNKNRSKVAKRKLETKGKLA